MDRQRQTRCRSCLLGVAALVYAGTAGALELGDFFADTLAGDGWRAAGITMQVSLGNDGVFAAEIRASSISLQAPSIELRDVRASCPRLLASATALSCPSARVNLRGLPLDSPRFEASWSYNLVSGDMQFAANRVALAKGMLRVTGSVRAGGWQARIGARGLSIPELARAAAPFVELPVPAGFEGKLDADFALAGPDSLASAAGQAHVYALTGGNEEGTLASDQLQAKLTIKAARNASKWQIDAALEDTAGQVYFHPVFVDFSAHALAGEISLLATPDGDWPLTFRLQQSGIGSAAGTAMLAGQNLRPLELELQINEGLLPGAYEVYLQPFLVGTTADSLETVGRLEARIRYRDGALRQFQASLQDIHMDDTRGRFAMYGLEGNIDWGYDSAGDSQLSWQGGYIYNVGLGLARLALKTGGGEIALAEKARIPVLDGMLTVSEFRLTHLNAAINQLEFDADIDSIGLRALTRALGWSPFAGSLSGSIPRMRFADDVITVDGALTAQVFDGTVTIENLQVLDPLGVLPQAQADVRLRNLDLAAVTSTFSFGNMEGRLDGDFKKLRMLGFSPVEFDARLYTTPGDRSRHRISQKAIENISDLGGAGAAAVLSRGMLRFFDAFSYDQIGWSCRLRDEVCRMDGVAAAPGNGYYIVKGKGLPRINVIGFSRRVSWPLLVEKLRNINAEGVSRSP